MDTNVKSVFDDACKALVIDAKLIKRIVDYKTRYINRNADHIAFFGGTLLGVQVVRFHTRDRAEWFESILGIEESDVIDRLHSLKDINPEFNVSSDAFNLSCLWLTYAFHRSTKLNPKQKEEGRFNTIMVLNIKLLTSLLYNYFKYPADEAVAKAAYAELSYKFSLKQEGSWYKYLESRSRDILDKKSIHYEVLTQFDKDLKIVATINDIQGRIRGAFKNIYGVFRNIHAQGIRIASSSAIIEHDGVEVLRDKTRSLTTYTRYLSSILHDQDSLMKEDLMQAIEKIMKTMPPKLFRETLQWLSLNYGTKYTELIDKNINAMMIHAFDYLNANRFLMRNTTDLPSLITKLKGTYMSSRNTDVALKEMRTDFENMVRLATGNKNDSILSSVRTGIMLYLVTRAISMKHYTN